MPAGDNPIDSTDYSLPAKRSFYPIAATGSVDPRITPLSLDLAPELQSKLMS